MLDLPKTTYFGKVIPKNKIYAHSRTDAAIEGLFITQVERIRWLHKISPATVNIAQGERVKEIQVIELTLKTPTPDKRLMQTILKAIRYKIVFVLVCAAKTTYTVYHDNKISFTSDVPPTLVGSDTDSVWENFVIQVKGGEIVEGCTLDEQIAAEKEREQLLRKIERLEMLAQRTKQPRRKWDLTENVKELRKGLEGV